MGRTDAVPEGQWTMSGQILKVESMGFFIDKECKREFSQVFVSTTRKIELTR